MSRNLPQCGLSQQQLWEKMEEMWSEGSIPESEWVCDKDGVPEELSGFGIQEREDYEIERFTEITCGGYDVEEETGWPVWVTWKESIPTWVFADNMSAYFTTCGDNPILEEEAAVIDRMRSEGGGSDYGDDFGWSTKEDQPGGFYSQARPYKSQERHFHQILRFIWSNKDDQAKLRKGWKRMWERVYQWAGKTQVSSVGAPTQFLFQKHINMLRAEFKKVGITSSGAQRASLSSGVKRASFTSQTRR